MARARRRDRRRGVCRGLPGAGSGRARQLQARVGSRLGQARGGGDTRCPLRLDTGLDACPAAGRRCRRVRRLFLTLNRQPRCARCRDDSFRPSRARAPTVPVLRRSLPPRVLRWWWAARARRVPERPNDRGGVARGLGSGVPNPAEGYCLTNHHVIDGADVDIESSLMIADLPGQILGSDPPTPCCCENHPGDSADADPRRFHASRVGDVVLAHRQSLRPRPDGDGRHHQREGPRHRLATAASRISSRPTRRSTCGNSGGPLVNTQGEFIGSTRRSCRRPAATSDRFRHPVQHGPHRDGAVDQFGGPRPSAVSSAHRRTADAGDREESRPGADARGVLVREVVPGGPAEAAGVQTGRCHHGDRRRPSRRHQLRSASRSRAASRGRPSP